MLRLSNENRGKENRESKAGYEMVWRHNKGSENEMDTRSAKQKELEERNEVYAQY